MEDKYNELLISIFKHTIKDSIRIGREDYDEGGFNLTDFSIKFTHINAHNDKTYEKINQLINMIIKDLEKPSVNIENLLDRYRI